MQVADNARLENRKSSNDQKIARMARILTIFGPKRLQRPKLFHEKFSNDRNERKVPEKFEKKIEQFSQSMLPDVADVIHYYRTLLNVPVLIGHSWHPHMFA